MDFPRWPGFDVETISLHPTALLICEIHFLEVVISYFLIKLIEVCDRYITSRRPAPLFEVICKMRPAVRISLWFYTKALRSFAAIYGGKSTPRAKLSPALECLALLCAALSRIKLPPYDIIWHNPRRSDFDSSLISNGFIPATSFRFIVLFCPFTGGQQVTEYNRVKIVVMYW